MNKSKTIPVVLGILVFGGAAILALSQPRSSQVKSGSGYSKIASSTQTSVPATTDPNPPSGGQTTPSGYTLVQIATHNDGTSCWSAIDGNVYDLTSWINQHPGGEGAILSICGKDGSGAFNNQHGGQSRPENILQTFKIGALITN